MIAKISTPKTWRGRQNDRWAQTVRRFEGVFRILGALRAPRMLDYPVKSVGSVQKYPKTAKILDTTSKIGRENPKIALFGVF